MNCVPLGLYTCYCNQSNALCLQLKHEADEAKEAKLQGLNLCPEDCLKLEKKNTPKFKMQRQNLISDVKPAIINNYEVPGNAPHQNPRCY